jgi:pyruvate formate-lyase activating enzyme-like uncharacterized protein
MGKDVIYADEWKLSSEEDTDILLEEAKSIAAEGAGITGGDPLQVWNRTYQYIQLLKNEFGDLFHIHLYTSGLVNPSKIPDLHTAGLDEIRFHPPPSQWSNLQKSIVDKSISKAQETSMDIAIEIPAIPTMETEIKQLINYANSKKIRWINLNELEFSEQNAQALIRQGYHVKNELSAAVLGSEETAMNILNEMKSKNLNVGLHYCSVSFKDGIQLRNRIIRRAHHTAKPYQHVTPEGTLLFGIIEHTIDKLVKLNHELHSTHKIPDDMYLLNQELNRMEIAGWILEKLIPLLKKQGFHCFIIEEYPTADHLEIERIPLTMN